jgi:archaellum component FlaC
MGIFDKVKGLFKKHEQQIDQGIDKAEQVAHDKIGDKVGHDKIDTAADKAHDAVDKLTDG